MSPIRDRHRAVAICVSSSRVMGTSATDPWWEINISIPDDLVEDAGALFIEAGALGCEHLSAQLPPPMFAGQSATVLPVAPAGCATLRLSFAADLTRDDVAALTLTTLAAIGLEHVPTGPITKRTDVDWAERWKEHFPPLQLGQRVFIVPSWERDFRVPPDGLAITLDPGLAFGTGQHATTALCVELIEAGLAAAPAASLQLLDVGCGSGILAMVAARLGCQRALAIDNDPSAVIVTRENVQQNGLSSTVQASDMGLEQIPGHFDWVVANILAQTLIALAAPLVAHTAPGGTLVLSGILVSQEDEVVAAINDAAQASGRTLPVTVRRAQRDEWLAVQLRI
jgi:ribosomal protein L11 methyltransferase